MNKNIIGDVTKSVNELVDDIIRGINTLSGKTCDYFLIDEDFYDMSIIGSRDTLCNILEVIVDKTDVDIERGVYSEFNDKEYDKEFLLNVTKDFEISVEKIYHDDYKIKNGVVKSGYYSIDTDVLFIENSASSKILKKCGDAKTIIFEIV